MKFNAVLVSLILFSLTAGAKDFCSKQIELSKKHLLEKHRIKMAKALNKAIESKACVSRKKELKEKLVNYLEIFISDESQQMYEKAKVSSQKEPSQSIELLKKALKKEEQNLVVLEYLQKVYFQQGKFEEAYHLGLSLETLTPYVHRNKKKLLLSLIFMKNYQKAWNLKKYSQGSSNIYDSLLLIELYFGLNKKREARELLERIKPETHPDVYLWRFNLEKQKSKKQKWAQKYKVACKSFSSDINKYFWGLKQPCKEKTILSYLKEKNNE